jgi:hypothetical protein
MHAQNLLSRTVPAREVLAALLLVLAVGLAGGWGARGFLPQPGTPSAPAQQLSSTHAVPHSEHLFQPPSTPAVSDQPTVIPGTGCCP